VGSVGLVLGAGGVVGGAYHAGTLAALSEATGWDARTADVIVGTSAGAVAGAILRGGLSADDQYARLIGAPMSTAGRHLVGRVREGGPIALRPRLPRSPRPAALQLVATALLPPWQARPGALLAGLLPMGSVPTTDIGDRLRELYDGRAWPSEPLWVCALRLRDGARVVFGRDDTAAPDVGTAVEASAAIPGYFSPVRIDGDAYVDGGAHSPSNADLLAGQGLDLVVVVSSMSAEWSALRPKVNLGGRVLAGFALERELRAIRAKGTPVLVFQPTADDIAVMGSNAMDPGRRVDVARQAHRSALRRLEHPSAAELVAALRASA
jgi:NTE family protein